MIVYLDTCCLNRPFDTLSNTSMYQECIAVLKILEMVESKELSFVWSDTLAEENSHHPNETTKTTINQLSKSSVQWLNINAEVERLALQYHLLGFGIKDSFHLAHAKFGCVQYFLTVDKKILNKNTKITDIEIMNPIDFLKRWEAKNVC